MEIKRRLVEDFVVSTILRARVGQREKQPSLGENLKIFLEET